MKIAESTETTHEIINIHYETTDDETHEKWVDICKDEKGEIMAITIGRTELTAFDLQILEFLKKEGKL